jgi:HlyD family secretion protein
MKVKTWVIGGTVVLALALAAGWAFAPRPIEVELATVTQGPFETTLDEDGKTRLTDRYVVSAPLAGRLVRIALKEGDAVAIDTPLAVLFAVLPAMLDARTQRELQARVQAAQDNAARAIARTTEALAATVGSRVIIERWGGKGALEGRVRSVEPAAFTKVSALGVEEQRVRVLIDITSPPADWHALGDGYRVSVRIVALSEANAVQVPVSAVFPLPSTAGVASENVAATARAAAPTRFAVFVADAGRARQTPVEVGARNGSAAWVLSGIRTGQQVIAYPPATVRDGLRVAARKR